MSKKNTQTMAYTNLRVVNCEPPMKINDFPHFLKKISVRWYFRGAAARIISGCWTGARVYLIFEGGDQMPFSFFPDFFGGVNTVHRTCNCYGYVVPFPFVTELDPPPPSCPRCPRVSPLRSPSSATGPSPSSISCPRVPLTVSPPGLINGVSSPDPSP